MTYRVCAGCGEGYDTRHQKTHLQSRDHRAAIVKMREAYEQRKTAERLIKHVYGLCQDDPCVCYVGMVH